MEIPSDCKDIECIAKLFLEQKGTIKSIPGDPEENSENSGKIRISWKSLWLNSPNIHFSQTDLMESELESKNHNWQCPR